MFVDIIPLHSSPIKEQGQEATEHVHPNFSKMTGSNLFVSPLLQTIIQQGGGRNIMLLDCSTLFFLNKDHPKYSVTHVQVFNLYSHRTAY